MRAEPPPPPRRRERQQKPVHGDQGTPARRQRCPYLEQILKEAAGPFHMLTRYKADCHVDHRTHRFTGRHPQPPCVTDPTPCALYKRARTDEDRSVARFTD